MWRGVRRRGSSFKFGASSWRVNPSAEVDGGSRRTGQGIVEQFGRAAKWRFAWKRTKDERAWMQPCVTERVRLGSKDTVWAEIGKSEQRI